MQGTESLQQHDSSGQTEMAADVVGASDSKCTASMKHVQRYDP